MRTRLLAGALLAATTACAALRTGAPAVRPLEEEGEALVLLLPPSRDAERLTFTLAGVSLVRQDGTEAPLALARTDVEVRANGGQQLLATGRIPPGDYDAVALRARAASVVRPEGAARLMVDEEPARAELGLHVVAGRALVVWLRLGEGPVQRDFAFAPRFTALLPPQTPPQLGMYCTNAGSADVTVADRAANLVTGALPVAGAPRGIALDAAAARAYVALPLEDQVEVVDLASGATIGRIRLGPGDGPTELALAPGRRLLVVNERSRTVSFVDPLAMTELSRVAVGDAPAAIVLDRAGRRAYVVNRGSASVSVLDVASALVAATIPTDPEPLRVQLSRDGTRLYVVQRGSMYLSSFALPSLAPLARGFIGLGAATLKVDPRTELLYLARAGEAALSVLEPVTLQVVDRFPLPGSPSYLAIDDVEDTLVAVIPERRSLAVIDLTSRKVLTEIPVGVAPHEVTLAAERP